jgi:acetyl esterase/lipase
VRLWSDEWEARRPQLRQEADEMIAGWAKAPEDPSMPMDQWVKEWRDGHVSIESLTSEKGVDRTIEGPAGPMRVRTFVPDQVDAVMLHIHGGGWVSGAPEMTDLLHEILSPMLNLAFVSVDYRLAPEHPYPAPNDDCEAAAVWLLEHAAAEFGSSRLLIGGESAGAHLAACTLLRVRDKHDAIDRFAGANLLFGQYDHGGTPSQRAVPERPDVLSNATLERIEECYLPGMSPEERRAPDISPLYADLRDLPPAFFSVGTDDHLVDDTLFMTARWLLAGNQAELVVYPETPHAGIAMPTVSADWFPRLQDFLGRCITG